jgi:amino acid permease
VFASSPHRACSSFGVAGTSYRLLDVLSTGDSQYSTVPRVPRYIQSYSTVLYGTVQYTVYTTFCSRFLGEGISSLFEPRSGVLATVCKVQSKGQNHNTETCECLAHSK